MFLLYVSVHCRHALTGSSEVTFVDVGVVDVDVAVAVRSHVLVEEAEGVHELVQRRAEGARAGGSEMQQLCTSLSPHAGRADHLPHNNTSSSFINTYLFS